MKKKEFNKEEKKVELKIEELEERIAPWRALGASHEMAALNGKVNGGEVGCPADGAAGSVVAAHNPNYTPPGG
jgi:hypothetical protein